MIINISGFARKPIFSRLNTSIFLNRKIKKKEPLLIVNPFPRTFNRHFQMSGIFIPHTFTNNLIVITNAMADLYLCKVDALHITQHDMTHFLSIFYCHYVMSQSICYFCNIFLRDKLIIFNDVTEFVLETLILNNSKKTVFYPSGS